MLFALPQAGYYGGGLVSLLHEHEAPWEEGYEGLMFTAAHTLDGPWSGLAKVAHRKEAGVGGQQPWAKLIKVSGPQFLAPRVGIKCPL